MDRDPAPGPQPWLPGRVGRWLARLDRRVRARGAVVVGLLACLIPALGGAAPANTGLVKVFTLPAGVHAYGVADGRIAVLTGPAQAPTFTAYRLRDGALLWAVPATGELSPRSGFSIASPPGVFLLVSGVPERSSQRTVAYDGATGRVLWQWDGRPGGTIDPGRVLVVTRIGQACDPPSCDRGDGNDTGEYEYAAVDLRTGQRSWVTRLTGPEHLTVALDGAPETAGPVRRMAMLDAANEIHVVDFDSGAELASRSLSPDTPEHLFFAHGLLLVRTRTANDPAAEPYFIALDATSLALRWRSDRLDATGGVWPCGRLVCLSAQDTTIALDPASGDQVELPRNWLWLADLGDGHQLAYPTPGPSTDDLRRWVLDGAGRPLFELSGWDATVSWPGRGYALLTWWQHNTLRAWFGLLDVDRRGVMPIGVLSGVAGSCEPVPARGGGYLICWMVGERIQVFRYAV